MKLTSAAALIAALAAIGAGGGYVATKPETIPATALVARSANLANGETMFNIGGCFSCHGTPDQKDRARLGGGHALKTPFGTFYVPNISTDPRNGIGSWSEPQFVSAMLKGTGRNGEHLYPAFPYSSYSRMRLDDVRDLFAYLRTLPGDGAPSKVHELSFPFNVRLGLGVWKFLFLEGRAYVDDPAKDAAYNRGAYLIEGPGHCAECHSSRNVMGGITISGRFAGGPDPEGKGYVPNITPHPAGLAKWSAKDIEYVLATGMTPDNDAVGSSMADVVDNTAKLSEPDRKAMALYLKSLPPRPGTKPAKAAQ